VLKEKGNKLFVAKKYTEAIAAYTEAIRFKADPIYYSNRAACYSFLGHYSSVIADTNEALALDPMYIKAINRRAIAYEKEQRWDKALYGKSDRKGGNRGTTDNFFLVWCRLYRCLYSG
jgi:import receptor subunit TOM70